ncbi:MAG: hypothetical protein VCA55_08140 [Verrucomicrobiales bacterium]
MRFPLLVTLLAALLFPGIADGRIGWTREKCIESFGEPVMMIAARLVKSEGQADVFKTKIGESSIRVIAEYRAGKVWMITYEGRGVKKNVAPSLVAKNAGPNVKESTFLRVQHWIEREKKLHAVYFTSPVQRLIVMNAASLAAEKKPSVPILLEPETQADNATDADGGKKPESASDPLDKF